MNKSLGAWAHPTVAATIAGVAAWVSRASFDVAGSTESPVRVAMLPSLAELMGLVVMSLLIAAGMASLLRTRAESDEPYWHPVGDALLPLFALGLLILPYLPWLADWVPAMRVLAGPGRLFVWMIVLGQVLWIFLPHVGSRFGLLSRERSRARAALVFACTAVFLSTPFVFNVRALPAAFGDLQRIVRDLPSARWSAVPSASAAVLFDQEFGILPYAPVLVLGFLGLGAMMRQPTQRRAVPLFVASLSLIVLAATVDPWWRRSAVPGRQLVLMLPLLVMPIAWIYERLPRQSLSRAAAQVLWLVSMGITLIVVLAERDVPLPQDAIGASSLLRWMSPTWQLWSEVPTYVTGSPLAASTRLVMWLGGLAVLTWILLRRAVHSEGRAALLVTAGVTVMCVAIPSATSVLISDAGKRFDVEARGLVPLLETFDPVARPIALRYDALSFVDAGDLPPMFALSAVRGQRTGRQPLRVVLNARFRLAAGSYVVDVERSSAAETVPDAAIFLQIGREGAALQSWPLTMAAGEHARYPFQVPLDAEFVGFRAAPPVEATIAALRITPVTIVETRRRFRTSPVLSAALFETVTAFFHDRHIFSERGGFWVTGRATARMTLSKLKETDPGVMLAIHSGARPNVVTLSTHEWSQRLALVPGSTERLMVPSKAGDLFIPLAIETTDGFVPAEVEASRDRRLLGAWIAVVPDEVSRTSVSR